MLQDVFVGPNDAPVGLLDMQLPACIHYGGVDRVPWSAEVRGHARDRGSFDDDGLQRPQQCHPGERYSCGGGLGGCLITAITASAAIATGTSHHAWASVASRWVDAGASARQCRSHDRSRLAQ